MFMYLGGVLLSFLIATVEFFNFTSTLVGAKDGLSKGIDGFRWRLIGKFDFYLSIVKFN